MAVATIHEGVFFTTPPNLPRGRHRLPREEVLAAQRERLLIAATELLAHGGYPGLKIGEIARRAGVSLAAFYDLFADKEACAFAAYERFIDVLLARIDALPVPDGDWIAFASSVLEEYLGALQDDPVVGRAFQVEIDAAGRTARLHRADALAQFAALLESRHEAQRTVDPALGPLPFTAYLAIVYSVRQLASDELDRAPAAPQLRAIAPDALRWLAATYLGAQAAERRLAPRPV